MSTIASKLAKIRQMPPRELAGRAGEVLRIHAERLRFRMSPPRDPAHRVRHITNVKEYLAAGPAQRFYFPAAGPSRDGFRDLVRREFPQWIDSAVADARVLCEHRLCLLGLEEVALGPAIDWHRDLVTGRVWPRRFWADYDLVHNPEAGDPKVIHELNRHQHLPRLGKAYMYTGDERFAREAVQQMESWIEQNPEAVGINWQSSLEIALRSVSWIWTLLMVLPSEALHERAARRILGSLLMQLDHVYRHPSTWTSPNTHLIGEAAALLIGGIVFSDDPRARAWRDFALPVLVAELHRQVGDDGVYGELSSWYHCYALDFYVQTLLLAKRQSLPLPEWAWGKLCRMVEVVQALTRPGGTIPLIGDDDGGRALALCNTSYRDFRDVLSTGAALFQRTDFRFTADRFAEETLWLMGEPGWQAFSSLAAAVPNALASDHAQAGYFIQRSGWSAADAHLLFDCGGMGLFNGGHAHADALAVNLFAGGEDLLVDPGTFIYNTAPETRRWFRSTEAHNTVTVDGAGQSEPGDTFTWRTRTAARLTKRFRLGAIECVEGEHTGYPGLRHRRRVLQFERGAWAVLDDFPGATGAHAYDFHWHLAPQVWPVPLPGGISEPELDCWIRGRNARAHLFMTATHPLRTEAMPGWVSEAYGRRTEAITLRARLQAAGPAAAITLMLPDLAVDPQPAATARRYVVESPGVAACLLEKGDCRDLFLLVAGNSELALAGCRMRGSFFWLRSEHLGSKDGSLELKHVLALDATSFRRGDAEVFGSSEPVGWFFAEFWNDGVTITRQDAEDRVYVRDLRDRELQHR